MELEDKNFQIESDEDIDIIFTKFNEFLRHKKTPKFQKSNLFIFLIYFI